MRGGSGEVVVIGSGAREHALVWGLAKSPHVTKIWAWPGNPGMDGMAERVDDLGAIARGRRLLVVVGPEAPLAEGLADQLRQAGHWVVGPGAEGARLEASKRWAKTVMERLGIPTASAQVVHSADELDAAIKAEAVWPHVMKQSRLAAGKGVVVAPGPEVAHAVAREWARDPDIWRDGVLWEECLTGREVSLHIVTNGREYRWLPLTRDHKRLTAAPDSPNTGGMGAFGPVEELDAAAVTTINHTILDPLMEDLTRRHIDYRGVLYVGLMMTAHGPKVLEFNVRLGDPEAEVLMPMLDVDWYEVWMAVAQGQLPTLSGPVSPAVAVVMAAPGYPGMPEVGIPLTIPLAIPEDTLIFHGATRWQTPGSLVSAGGRVLTVVGRGPTVGDARRQAYQAVEAIGFPGCQVREDIAANDSLE